MFFHRKKSRREAIAERLKDQPKALLEKGGRLVERPKAVLLEKSTAVLDRIHPHPKTHRTRNWVTGAVVGAATIYFFDPQQGRRRRAVAMDRARGLAGRAATRLRRAGGKVASDAYGMRQRMAHPYPEDTSYNDATLAAKVESELFVGRDIPKDRVKINAENGVVVLRGEVDRPEQIRELERAAAKIPGVMGVRTLLHLPNTPAPNKTDAMRAG